MHTHEEIYTEYIYVGKNEEEKRKDFFAGRFTRVIDHFLLNAMSWDS